MNFNWDITPTVILQTLLHLVVLTAILVRLNDSSKRHEEKLKTEESLRQKLEKELSEFKLEVAREYASKATMSEALRPLLDELHALRDRIDKLIDRRNG